MHSLRFRLLMTLVVVVVVAVGTVAVFTSRSTTSQFQRYVARDIERDQRVLEAVLQSYQEGEDRQNVQALVKKMARAAGDRIVVVDNTGRVIADSADQLVGQTLPLPMPFSPAPPPWSLGEQPAPGLHGPVAADVPFLAPIFVRVAPAPNAGPGAPVPDFIVARAPVAGPGSSEAAFLGSMNRSLILAVAAAGLVALLLTAALSRRILAPIESLTAAARKMEKGDLSQRVRVQSRDEIGALAQAFNAMADGLGRLEGLRRNMVTDIAHELRTPLTNIRGYLEALRDGVVQPDSAIIDSLHE